MVGYLASWEDPRPLAYERLTHLNYAFVLPTATGGLTPVPAPARLAAVVREAHAHGVKVSL